MHSQKHVALVAVITLVAACGHGRRPAGGGGDPVEDAAVEVAAFDAGVDATPPDASPFPPEFSIKKSEQPCDPRHPDLENSNCCAASSCRRRDCSYDILESDVHNGRPLITIGAGWDQYLIKGEKGVFVTEGGDITKIELVVFRISADRAWASADRYQHIQPLTRVKMNGGCREWSRH